MGLLDIRLACLVLVFVPTVAQATEVCRDKPPQFPWVNSLRTGLGIGGRTVTNQTWHLALHGDVSYQLPLVMSRCGMRSSSGIFTTTSHWSLGFGSAVSGTINAANPSLSRYAMGARLSIDNMILGFPQELNPMLSFYVQAGPTFGQEGTGLGGRLGASAWLIGGGLQYEAIDRNGAELRVLGLFLDLTNIHTLIALWLSED